MTAASVARPVARLATGRFAWRCPVCGAHDGGYVGRSRAAEAYRNHRLRTGCPEASS